MCYEYFVPTTILLPNYFMLVIPQTIRRMFGEETEYDFYRCTGWPLSSAGLEKYLFPRQMLDEASLFPVKAEY